jgi:diphthamide synthase (EF-2-diphthine--ammonia ligase)
VRQDPTLRVVGLITTVTAEYDRISMHGVRRTLLAAYEAALGQALEPWRASGVRRVVFGDLFLADVRAYREQHLATLGMAGHYPLWGEDTTQLARQFIDLGFRAILVCVDPKQLDASFAGRAFDASLLFDLPPQADPCGERGEFHTFVTAGPIFVHPIAVSCGDTVTRDGFVFCDLLPTAA